MKMNRMICLDKANMTMTVQPGMLLTEVAAAAAAEGLFYPPDPGEKQRPSEEMLLRMQAACVLSAMA